uniref:Uncharacterized protein n=1 Tax=Kalanchoe fedtschenkoi TaxID=63787 RepID=A0A7N0TX94_KALFE
MGVKFWNFQHLIPACFYLVGDTRHASTIQPHDHQPAPIDKDPPQPRRRKKRPIKVITSNGIVRVYTKPLRASKLMLEFPTHLLCRSDSLYIGQKIPSLSPKKKLKRGHNYFLLPRPYFQSTLTFASAAASFAAAAAAQPRGYYSTKLANSCKAFSIEKARNGVLKIRVSDEFIAQLTSEQRKATTANAAAEEERVCNTPQLMKEYSQLVESSRQWRPKLETISEKDKRKFKSFRRKKVVQPSKGLIVSQLHHSQMSPMKSPRSKNKVAKFRKS